MENEDRVTKNNLVDYMSTELADREDKTGFPDRDAEYFHEMEIMTYTRNAFYNMPISDYQAGLIYDETGGCNILDDIYTFWRDRVGEWGEWHDEKLGNAIELVEKYMESVERRSLAHKLYDKVMAEAVEFNKELISKSADTILSNALRFVAFNAMLPLLEPPNDLGNRETLALLTLDRPLAAVYDIWRNTKDVELCKKDLTGAIIKTADAHMHDIFLELADDKAQNPESQHFLSVYVSKYLGDMAADGQFQEQEADGAGMEP